MARPQFDSRISLGNILQFGTLIIGGLYALVMMQDQANDNATAIKSLGASVEQVSTSVGIAVSRLEREIDNDLDEVAEVVDNVDEKVDQVITEQTTARIRIASVENDQKKLEDALATTNTVALTVQSNANRDRAVEAQRHQTLVEAIDDLKQIVRRSN